MLSEKTPSKDPFASASLQEELDFFSDYDNDSTRTLKPTTHKFQLLAKLVAPSGLVSKGRVNTPKKKKEKKKKKDPVMLNKRKGLVTLIGSQVLQGIDSPKSEDTFRLTSSFRIPSTPTQSPPHEDLKHTVLNVENLLHKQSEVTGTESLSMQEFDRLCRTYSENGNSPQVKYLMKSSKLNLVPQSILVSHLWGVETEINLNGRGFDSSYITSFAETVKSGLRPGIHTIRLSRNRIDDEGGGKLFEGFREGNCQLEILDLSSNEIGNGCMNGLSNFLRLGHLMELDLSNNCLRGKGVEVLCEGIAKQNGLTNLNLTGNEVGEAGAIALAKLLKGEGCSLTMLGLAWTELSGFHGAKLLGAVAENKTVVTLDVSFNTLGGSSKENPCVTALGKVFARNRTLKHLDCSYNHFTTKNTIELSKEMTKNHQLLGLHYEGNSGWVDSRGFLRCVQTNIKKNNLDMGGFCGIVHLSGKGPKIKMPSCWCCSSWVEETFEFNVAKNGGDEDQGLSEGVFLCLSIDTPAYTPTRMMMVEPGLWRINRMLPPGVCEYMFQYTKGGKVVREHHTDQPTLGKLKGVTSVVGKTDIFANLSRLPGKSKNPNSNPFMSAAQNAKGGEGSVLVHAFGIGEKKGMLGNRFMKKQTSSKNLWQKKMAKAKNNLSNRDRMAMKELAKKNLYGEETEGDIVDFERVEREIIDRAQSHIEGMGGVRRIMSPPKKDKPKSPKKKNRKKGKGKKGGKEKEEKKKEKKEEKKEKKEKTLSPEEEAKRAAEEETKKKIMASRLSLNSKAFAMIKKMAEADCEFGRETSETLSKVRAEIKNSVFKFPSKLFECEIALPRLLRPYGEEGDDDDPYGLNKKGGGKGAYDFSKGIFAGRDACMESKDYFDSRKGKARVHERACAADVLNGDLKALLEKLKVEDVTECLEVIQEFFQLICDVFKAYSTKVDVPNSLTLNTFTEFALDCEIIDHDQCSLNAVDTIFIHANLKTKKPSFAEKAYGGVLIKNTKHLMQRYQFIIALVRIAYAKNGGRNQRGKLNEALRVLFVDHILPNGQMITGDEYRKRFVYIEAIDKVLEAKGEELKKLYEKHSHTKIPMMFIPKNLLHKGMSLDEFLTMLDLADILDQTLSMREAKISYVGSLPMMESVVITPHLSLSFFDFAEALIRAAHIIYDSLGDDTMDVIPMLRDLDTQEKPSVECVEAIADILSQFVEDLVATKKTKNATPSESESSESEAEVENEEKKRAEVDSEEVVRNQKASAEDVMNNEPGAMHRHNSFDEHHHHHHHRHHGISELKKKVHDKKVHSEGHMHHHHISGIAGVVGAVKEHEEHHEDVKDELLQSLSSIFAQPTGGKKPTALQKEGLRAKKMLRRGTSCGGPGGLGLSSKDLLSLGSPEGGSSRRISPKISPTSSKAGSKAGSKSNSRVGSRDVSRQNSARGEKSCNIITKKITCELL
ncbi:hypothetical protein TrLO_g6773 [Triparma laevis f. longispina]|uniref:Uncharacterized protein n=1 Tax=Triparma laevis f. longispina TaxID=1714387 RepID=A0A9W7FK38_9STRA|nr:hypothetical protein TrLO_g6773 [Triparma laevis f. longispina]